jgi:hypothetical protein
MPFGYGWSCHHELMIFLLEKGRWHCSGCGSEIISTHKIMSIDSIDELIADGIAKELKDANL